MKALVTSRPCSILGQWRAILIVLAILPLLGCISRQTDLQVLHQRIKQTSDESAQTRARQSQEISMLREQELPQLRGQQERALHQAQELQGKQEDLQQRVAQLEQEVKRLGQLSGRAAPPLKDSMSPSSKSIEAKLDIQAELISSLNTQIADLLSRIQVIEKK